MVAHADHRWLTVFAMVPATAPLTTVSTFIALTAGFAWLILLLGPVLARAIL